MNDIFPSLEQAGGILRQGEVFPMRLDCRRSRQLGDFSSGSTAV